MRPFLPSIAGALALVSLAACAPATGVGPGPAGSPSAMPSVVPSASSVASAVPTGAPVASPSPVPLASPSPSPTPSPSPAVTSPSVSPLVFNGQVKLLGGNGLQGDFARTGTPNLEQVPFDKATAMVVDGKDRMLFLEPNRSRIGSFSEAYAQSDGKLYRVVSTYTTLPYRRLQAMIRYGDGLLLSDGFAHQILKVDAQQKVTVFAGAGTAGFSGDGGPALTAQFNNPWGLATDSAGNVFVADSNNQVIRRIDKNGIISTFAGTPLQALDTGAAGGDNGLAISAKFSYPSLLAIDGNDRLFIYDERFQVRTINREGNVKLVLGSGSQAFDGDKPDATTAGVGRLQSMVIGPDGLLYVADTANNRIRRVNADGSIVTLVGSGQSSGFPQYEDKPLAIVCGAPTVLAFNQKMSLVYYQNTNFRWQETLLQ